MHEKVLEDWLINSTEREYQYFLAEILKTRGETIIHLTRHCPTEYGKDIITRTAAGYYHAYQLKTGKISLTNWRNEVSNQAYEGILAQTFHPSIPRGEKLSHYFVVTNMGIEEEVWPLIEGMNINFRERGLAEIKTIVGSEILAWAKNLYVEHWPSGASNLAIFLNLMMWDGKEFFPKDLYFEFLMDQLAFWREKNKKPGNPSKLRLIRSLSAFSMVLFKQFVKEKNHYALFEGLVSLISFQLYLMEELSISYDEYLPDYKFLLNAIFASLNDLLEETKARDNLIEGDGLSDCFFIGPRITIIMGALAALGISNRTSRDDAQEIKKLLFKYLPKKKLWGESGIPFFLLIFFLLKKMDPTPLPDIFLRSVLRILLHVKTSHEEMYFPSSYVGPSEAVEILSDLELTTFLGYGRNTLIQGKQNSTYLESQYLPIVVLQYVRLNWRRDFTGFWPEISKVSQRSFVFKHWHDFFLWRAKSGTDCQRVPEPTASYSTMKEQSLTVDKSKLPENIEFIAELLPFFVLVFPHRGSHDLFNFIHKNQIA